MFRLPRHQPGRQGRVDTNGHVFIGEDGFELRQRRRGFGSDLAERSRGCLARRGITALQRLGEIGDGRCGVRAHAPQRVGSHTAALGRFMRERGSQRRQGVVAEARQRGADERFQQGVVLLIRRQIEQVTGRALGDWTEITQSFHRGKLDVKLLVLERCDERRHRELRLRSHLRDHWRDGRAHAGVLILERLQEHRQQGRARRLVDLPQRLGRLDAHQHVLVLEEFAQLRQRELGQRAKLRQCLSGTIAHFRIGVRKRLQTVGQDGAFFRLRVPLVLGMNKRNQDE